MPRSENQRALDLAMGFLSSSRALALMAEKAIRGVKTTDVVINMLNGKLVAILGEYRLKVDAWRDELTAASAGRAMGPPDA